MGCIEENPGEKGTRLIRSSVELLLLLSCGEHAPHLFCKLGKNLGQDGMGITGAILASRLFHVFRGRFLSGYSFSLSSKVTLLGTELFSISEKRSAMGSP